MSKETKTGSPLSKLSIFSIFREQAGYQYPTYSLLLPVRWTKAVLMNSAEHTDFSTAGETGCPCMMLKNPLKIQ